MGRDKQKRIALCRLLRCEHVLGQLFRGAGGGQKGDDLVEPRRGFLDQHQGAKEDQVGSLVMIHKISAFQFPSRTVAFSRLEL